MTKLLPLLASFALLTSPASAGLRWCPIDQAYFDTSTGRIVDGPSAPLSSPSRSSSTSDIEWTYRGYSEILGY